MLLNSNTDDDDELLSKSNIIYSRESRISFY